MSSRENPDPESAAPEPPAAHVSAQGSGCAPVAAAQLGMMTMGG